MALAFRWLLRLFVGLAALAGLALFIGYWFGARSLPDYDAEVSVAGLSAPVEIVRNNANVPHIFGETDTDVFFGLGFSHAQDRLWQMMMMRRTAQGRLSEIFGERTVQIDELLRRLDVYNLAVQSVGAQTPETFAALNAYSAGVNARLRQINEDALGRGAPEMFFFSNQLAPWQPADSIAIIKLMGLQLASHLQEEVLRARTSLLLPNERLADLLPDAPGVGISALPEFGSLFPDLPKFAETTTAPRHPMMPIQPRGLAGASNVWAAAPGRSAAGGTLLAN
ncbi:MAG: penicillin acylase family protein, partial [Pseudomonadota bacterium]